LYAGNTIACKMISSTIHWHVEGIEFLGFSTSCGIQLKHLPMYAVPSLSLPLSRTISLAATVTLAVEFPTQNLPSSLSRSFEVHAPPWFEI
jgi:hypothetical protein